MSHADIEAELDGIADEIDARLVEEEALSQMDKKLLSAWEEAVDQATRKWQVQNDEFQRIQKQYKETLAHGIVGIGALRQSLKTCGDTLDKLAKQKRRAEEALAMKQDSLQRSRGGGPRESDPGSAESDGLARRVQLGLATPWESIKGASKGFSLVPSSSNAVPSDDTGQDHQPQHQAEVDEANNEDEDEDEEEESDAAPLPPSNGNAQPVRASEETRQRHSSHTWTWSRLAIDDWSASQYEARTRMTFKFIGAGQWPLKPPADASDSWLIPPIPRKQLPPSKLAPLAVFEGGLEVPGWAFDHLHDYQRVGVQWMWELHCQEVGGIIADEMGLGKTVQTAVFLASLAASRHIATTHPVLIVAPVSVLTHWVKELHLWWPAARVLVLHAALGSGGRASLEEDALLSVMEEQRRRSSAAGHCVVVLSYETMVRLEASLVPLTWSYVILDEGHRIRNAQSSMSMVARQLQCRHRLILSGAPVQNSLMELWSLMDFVYPGKLGTKESFEREYYWPITKGTRSGALKTVMERARSISEVLHATISPYLLRRKKKDIQLLLPGRSEKVLLCALTPAQETAYRAILQLPQVAAASALSQEWSRTRSWLQNRRQMDAFQAIGALRQVCNHPQLRHGKLLNAGKKREANNDGWSRGWKRQKQSRAARFAALCDSDEENRLMGKVGVAGNDNDEEEEEDDDDEEEEGIPHRLDWQLSGKLQVTQRVLRNWHAGGHRTLLFCQGIRMLDTVEHMVQEMDLSYLRMDGATPTSKRSALVDRFNSSEEIAVFLLTSRVGGVGLNLTGADRVLLVDPDWNPCVDMQARERAWRLGQKRQVTIYRLITRGTIEELIYHRQIVKNSMASAVLADPTALRSLRASDLSDLLAPPSQHSFLEHENHMVLGDEPQARGRKQKQTKEAEQEEEQEQGQGMEKGIKTEGGEDSLGGVEVENDDDFLLGHLMGAQHVHGALSHDVLYSGEATESREETSRRRQAEKTARQAADQASQALVSTRHRSRTSSLLSPVPVASTLQRDIPLSSAAIMASLKNLHGRSQPEPTSAQPTLASAVPITSELVHFFQKQPHLRATSAEVLVAFQNRISTDAAPLLRACLQSVAVLHQLKPVAQWVLKDSFATL